MKEKLLRAIEENGLIEKGDTVLAAFSGGADSTALMFALSCIRENLGFELIAAHYNHGIRQEADADESFCRETAEMLGLRFFSEKGDVPVFAKENGLSLETAARLLRYRFLSDVAEKTGAASVAVAHHAEDSAESILLHLIRGSGLSGLTGIRYKNTLDLSYAEKAIGKSIKKNLVLIRPLLGCTKEDILSFLEEQEMSYRTDETNYISDTARNRLRLQIIPELEKLNPAAALNIVRAGEILSEDEEFLLSGARKELENAREGEGFSAKKLASLPEPVKKRCLRLAISEKATLVDIERTHLESLSELLDMQSGAALDLPRARARLSFGKLFIEPAETGRGGSGKNSKEAEIVIPVREGEYETPFGLFKIEIITSLPMEKSDKEEYNVNKYSQFGNNVGFIDAEKAGESFLIRTRRAGDRFRPVNSAFRMKLKDFFIGRKTDEKKRDGIPLVLCGGEIAFIPGFLVSDDFKITAETEKALKIRYFEKQ